jgi:hypothetical protein
MVPLPRSGGMARVTSGHDTARQYGGTKQEEQAGVVAVRSRSPGHNVINGRHCSNNTIPRPAMAGVLEQLCVREKLLICQAVHDVGAQAWDKVSALLDGHPLWTKERRKGFFTEQVCTTLARLQLVHRLAALSGCLRRAHAGRRQRHVRRLCGRAIVNVELIAARTQPIAGTEKPKGELENELPTDNQQLSGPHSPRPLQTRSQVVHGARQGDSYRPDARR